MKSRHAAKTTEKKPIPAAIEAKHRLPVSVEMHDSKGAIPGGQEKSKQIEDLQTLGEKRLIAELSTKPSELLKFAQRYRDLVDSLAGMLRDKLRVQNEGSVSKKSAAHKVTSEERFIIGIWEILSCQLEIAFSGYGDGQLHESLTTKTWDCDTSAFLVFDTATLLGIDARIAVVTNHAFIVTDNFFFETTCGYFAPIRELGSKYPHVQFSSKDHNALMAISHNNICCKYSRNKDFNSALAEVDKSVRIQPDYADTYRHRGCVLRMLGKNQESLADLQKSLSMNPYDSDSYFQLGCTYMELKDFPKAIESYKKAAEIAVEFKTYTCLGMAYLQNGDHQKAVNELNKAHTLKPRDSGTLNNRGFAHAQLGNHRRAIDDYSLAIEYQSNLVKAYRNRSDSYFALGENWKAKNNLWIARMLALKRVCKVSLLIRTVQDVVKVILGLAKQVRSMTGRLPNVTDKIEVLAN